MRKLNSNEEALYYFIYGEDFDNEAYDSWEEAVENEVEDLGYKYYELPMYALDGGEYAVTNDYDDAEESAKQSVKELLDNLGIGGFNVDKEDFIQYSESELLSEINDYYIGYAEDIKSYSADFPYINRLHEEMVQQGVMEEPDEDEVPEEGSEEWDNYVSEIEDELDDNINDFADKLTEEYEDDPLEYYRNMYGDIDKTIKTLSEQGRITIDEDKLADEVISTDGVGHILSSYDGEEHEVGDYYIYRVN